MGGGGREGEGGQRGGEGAAAAGGAPALGSTTYRDYCTRLHTHTHAHTHVHTHARTDTHTHTHRHTDAHNIMGQDRNPQHQKMINPPSTHVYEGLRASFSGRLFLRPPPPPTLPRRNRLFCVNISLQRYIRLHI